MTTMTTTTTTTTAATDAELYARNLARDIESLADDADALDAWYADVLDIEYIADASKRLLGANIYVTVGGPTAYVDTRAHNVVVVWGDARAIYGISEQAADTLYEYAAELWEC